MDKLSVPALLSAEHSIAGGIISDYGFPWLFIPDIRDIIYALFKKLDLSQYVQISEDVFAHKTAKIADTARTEGPALICEGSEIRHCAFIRGRVIIGRGATVGNSTEVKNSVLFDDVKIPHFNYVGDSVLGHGCHLGAGAVTSNVRADRSEIIIKYGGGIKTGLKKLGAILGDGCEIGCNATLNPGTVAGRRATVYPNSSVRGVIPPDCIYKNKDEVIIRR